ncbi:hypothetical protein NP233_g7194 [Leucocoprinus birnbaumii]|uniref:Uncharacterized protein n=1 Tax=Leucocoprinus birnbaumii TaxID=56174 RepID=A0AAD5YQ83_9AGAR|nr:hypothetical protein NP233_g7194 [Leucocoprinus birnbaumii]
MVLVAEKNFRFMKAYTVASFIFYAYSQVHVEFSVAQPEEAAYYPRHDAFKMFLVLQAIIQVVWLHKLFVSPRNPQLQPIFQFSKAASTTSSTSDINSPESSPAEVIMEVLQAEYAPVYSSHNCFMGKCSLIVVFLWIFEPELINPNAAFINFLWLKENFIGAQLSYITNAFSHICLIGFLLNKQSLSWKNWHTHAVVKTSTGLGFLFVWRGWGMIDDRLNPPFSELVQTLMICLLLTIAAGPDPTLGLCLVYGLLTLAYGPGISDRWRTAFKYDIAIVGATILIDFVAAKIRGVTIIREDTSKPPIEEDLMIIDGEGKKQWSFLDLNASV